MGQDLKYWDMPVYTGNKWSSPYESRTWTLKEEIPGYGTQFEATFVGISGFDTPHSQSYVVFLRHDGKKRALPLAKFCVEDQEYALKLQQEIIEVTKKARIGKELATYKAKSGLDTNSADGTNARKPGIYGRGAWNVVPSEEEATVETTKYFRFIAGKKGDSKWFDKEFREKTKQYFDWMYEFIVYELGAPGPFCDEAEKYKIDVMVLNTGLGEGWAFGGTSMWVTADVLEIGSGYIPHEFAHVLQHYSGGMRNCGWGFFEQHSQWVSHQYNLGEVNHLPTHASKWNYHLSSNMNIYIAYIFMQFMTEQPEIGPNYMIRLFYDSKRENDDKIRREHGKTLEDPFQAWMRFGKEDGVFEDPAKGFGDIIGKMAAHNATWDYVYGYTYKQAVPPTRYNRVILEPVVDRPGWYRCPDGFAPQQYGHNVIELELAEDAEEIKLDFHGIQVDDSADWRATLVVVDKECNVRYSEMINKGETSIKLTGDEVEAYLTVAATPSTYKPVNTRKDGFRAIIKYPYEVKLTGAVPAQVVPDRIAFDQVEGSAHPNGGGFVANSAMVEPSVYVGKDACVLGEAKVSGNARIEDFAVVTDHAEVSGFAVIGGNALVRDKVKVSGNAVIRSSELKGELTVTDSARIIDGMLVEGSGLVNGRATLKGRSYVSTSTKDVKATITGNTIIGINAEWRPRNDKPITSGIFTEHPPWRDEDLIYVPGGLYLHYDFSDKNPYVVKDRVYYTDGVVRGNPEYVVDCGISAINLNGRDQYVVLERDAAEFDKLTVEVTFKWLGGEADQPVFDFGSGSDRMYLTPCNQDGKPEFAVLANGERVSVAGEQALRVGEWVRIKTVFNSAVISLELKGKGIGKAHNSCINPLSLRPVANYIGRNQDGTKFLNGLISEFKIYGK